MYQHSTLCFRKHSRHRFLVTAPSIHENNFVLTSVWGGGVGRGGGGLGEAINRRQILLATAFAYFTKLICTKSAHVASISQEKLQISKGSHKPVAL